MRLRASVFAPCVLLFLACTSFAGSPQTPRVVLTPDHLVVDGTDVGMLFGAEIQYFRARGGPGRNVPRATVEAQWAKLLDRVQEAHMNAVTFYIPWDFHEPVEGVFDFDGTLDRDGDGNPDYPSRDLRGFLRMVEQRGIKNVMVRPGPYINAEWGHEGFGAIPLWLLENYPQALTGSRTAGRARTVSFGSPVFREKAKKWIDTLYNQVLKDFIGPGKPIIFVQLDNETNYFWDSVYERDLSPVGLGRYRDFLSARFHSDIAELNRTYQSNIDSFAAVNPPASPDDRSLADPRWHYDWFHWHDLEIQQYHQFLKDTWAQAGLTEMDVLFSTCDSFNGGGWGYGLLPRLDYRQNGGLSFSTMNIYPKTWGTQTESTMNWPMKGAHDAVLFGSSHRQFYGTAADWVMTTETVGGWFSPTEVSLATLEHTYGSILGSGVKAMIIYYFNEGWNWNDLEQTDSELFFNAPLDKNMDPRPSFTLLKNLGAALASGLGEKIVTSTLRKGPILIAHDTESQYPTPGSPRTMDINSNDSAGLYGYFRELGVVPDVAYVDRLSPEELSTFKLVVWQNPGNLSDRALANMSAYLERGGMVLAIGNVPDVWRDHPRVEHRDDNPAAGWNENNYATLADASSRLDQGRAILARAGIEPMVRTTATDGQPFAHAWLKSRSNQGLNLLFIENFHRDLREFNIRITRGQLPVARLYRVHPVWTGVGIEQGYDDRIVTADALAATGVVVPVSPDGVDIWEIEALP